MNRALGRHIGQFNLFALIVKLKSPLPPLKFKIYNSAIAHKAKSSLPPPTGGGGTSFIPFFSIVGDNWDGLKSAICVYLTDGYGSFPDKKPELPVLWVVTPGGLSVEEFPFGEAVKLLSF